MRCGTVATATATASVMSSKAGVGGRRSAASGASVVAMHWFRKGLRLHDNPALLASLDVARSAANDGRGEGRVYPVYVLDGDCYQQRRCTALRANFLVECLSDLDASLRERGSRLYVARGDPTVVLPDLWETLGVTHLTHEADETGEPYAAGRDAAVHRLATERGIDVRSFPSETLHPLKDGYVENVGGDVEKVPSTMGSFQGVFGRMGAVPETREAPRRDDFPTGQDHGEYSGQMLPPKKATDLPWPRNVTREDVTPIWGPADCENLRPIVRGGESRALSKLKESARRPAWVASFEKPKTSCTDLTPSTTALSPYLSVGCLSPRTAWHALSEAKSRAPASAPKSKPPVSLHGQLMWRDFNNLIAHAANAREPGSWGRMEGNVYCREVPWSSDSDLLDAWKSGRTGYPWIDACMAQLRTEGWIHHLGRHAVACFLTRGDLWQSWEEGAAHFEAELLDADYALNGFNWLWLSCSGFFYQYFRCYSPVSFQKKNDPTGRYIRKWIPALAGLPDKFIYEPWKAPIATQKAAGVRIGVDYPKPIVDHAVLSKENMEKMSLAYDLHKEKAGGGGGGSSSTKTKAKSRKGSEGGPAKKKSRRQTKLK